MKLVVALGNPGEKYQQTRHNAGFILADRLVQDKSWNLHKNGLYQAAWLRFNSAADSAAEFPAKRTEVQVIKPLTFMNRSGQAVAAAVSRRSDFEFNKLFVIHDDLDLTLGQFKLQLGTGPKQHRGLLSIYRVLGTDQFWHVRVGVDNRQGERNIPPERYVLTQFQTEELDLLRELAPEILRHLKNKLIETD